jgi:anti-anti-sigma factor
MDTAHVDVQQLDDAAFVALEGRLEADAAREVADTLEGLLAGGRRHLIVDLQGVRHADALVLRVFLQTARRLRERGGDLKLCCVPRAVRTLIAALGIGEYVAVYADRTGALLACPPSVRAQAGHGDRRGGHDRRQATLPFDGPDRRRGERSGF